MALLAQAPVASAQALTVVGRSQAETFATEIAFDPALSRAFVTNNWTNSVTVIDSESYQVLARIEVGARPNGIAIDTVRHRAYVANWGSHEITVIDTQSMSLVGRAVVGNGVYPYSAYPTMVALDASGNTLYVTHDVPAGTVSVVDTQSLTTVDQIITNGGSSVGIAFDPVRNMIFASTYGSQLFAIDAASRQLQWHLSGTGSGHVRWSSESGAIYVGSNSFVDGVQGITRVDPTTETIVSRALLGNVGVFSVGGAFGRVYAPQYWNDRLAVLDAELRAEIGAYLTCCHSTSAAIDPATDLIWYADELGNIVILRDDVPPPLQAEPQHVNIEEDTPANITLASTGGSAGTTYAVTEGPAHGTISLTGTHVAYVPAHDFHGQDQFTFRAVDGGATSTATVTISVAPVNDAPEVMAGGPYGAAIGDPVTLTANGSDVEDGLPSLSWDLDGDGIFETPGGVATLTVTSVTPRTVTVKASDSGGLTTTAVATVVGSYQVCLLYRPDHAVRSGATVPVRLQLCDSHGANLSSPSIVLNALQVVRTSDQVSGIVEDAGHANPDANFRYDPAIGGYVFNLKTTGLVQGSYSVLFTADDSGRMYAAPFQVK